jgi:aminoacyl tRNA synthase complex-interacting multifunctional protein 1
MKVFSSAALGTLTVSAGDLASDPLLELVCKLASSLQLTVKSPKKGAISLELPSGKTLTQRNAIVRCICGMGLHNALDGTLLGGHMAAVSSSPVHAMAIASISSWMSVADHAKKEASLQPLMEQLEAHLETRAFLSPSATCTVADVDVGVLVARKAKDLLPSFPNVHRWLVTVSAFLGDNDISLPVEPIANSHSTPMFFYGTEANVVMPQKKAVAPPPKPAEAAQKGGNQQQQKGAGKKDNNKKGGKQPQQQQEQKQVASWDVSALDIRVGKILKVWPHPEAEKLFCEEIDVGEDQPRQIASGLRPFYKQEDLDGRRVVVLCNLKARKLVGFPSHGMVLCATNADHTSVETMEPPADAKIGERVMFEGITGDPEPENKIAKKKVFEAVAPDLKTNTEGVCVWKAAVSVTTAGPIKASKGMAGAQVA